MNKQLTELNVVNPIKVTTSENYDIIITDAKDVTHFFFRKDGEMMYDGYCRPCGDVAADDQTNNNE